MIDCQKNLRIHKINTQSKKLNEMTTNILLFSRIQLTSYSVNILHLCQDIIGSTYTIMYYVI